MRYYCVLKSFLDLPILSSESQGSLYFLHCLIFKMLLLIFGDELFYYTTFKFICQPLLEVFFKFSFLWRSLLRDSFNIISHSKFFVKYFFQVFSKNFFVTAVPFPDQLFYYITSKLFCQPLFRSFFKFVFPWYLSYLCDSFFIISLSHWFVKYFLFKFLILPID